jgi:hypothetical protein
MKEVLGTNLEEAMSLDELEAKASLVEKVFKDFRESRKKHNV